MDRVADPDRSGPIGRRGLDVEALVAPAPSPRSRGKRARFGCWVTRRRCSVHQRTISSASRSGWSRETKVRAPRNSTSVASGKVASSRFARSYLKNGSFGAQHSSTGLSKVSSHRAASTSSSGSHPLANVVTSRRTPSSVRYGVTQGRLSSASSRRRTSPPKPSLLCRRKLERIGCISAVASTGCRATRNSAANGAGGNESNASQLVSTSRPTRLRSSSSSSCDTAPPVSLPTIITSCRSRASRKLATTRATPRGDRSAPGFMGVVCEASGQVGANVRNPASASRSGTSDHRVSSTRNPCTNTTGRPPSGPLSR